MVVWKSTYNELFDLFAAEKHDNIELLATITSLRHDISVLLRENRELRIRLEDLQK